MFNPLKFIVYAGGQVKLSEIHTVQRKCTDQAVIR